MSGRPGPGHEDDRRNDDFERVYWTFSTVAALGLGGAALYAFATGSGPLQAASIFGAASLMAGAAALVGSLVGFLFAVPRSRQDQQLPREKTDEEKRTSRRLSDYAANTNLEQISDWLTKILVGAGLVELGNLPAFFSRAAAALAPAIAASAPAAGAQSEATTAKSVALCLMVYFLPWGFFFSYLITRLWLPKALSRAEREEELRNLAIEEAELRTLERRAYTLLFEKPPQGFSSAIDLIESYQRQPMATPSAWLWLYLACAYGQKHAFEKKEAGSDEELQARTRVQEAVRNALALNPGLLPILERLYQGTDPNEDDLASLKKDDVVERLFSLAAR